MRVLTMSGAVAALIVALTVAQSAGQAPPWRHADPAYRLSLPADHASHPEYRLEWWYYTGHLDAADGRRFGYQLTFFRVGVDPAPVNPSRWTVRDLHMAHAAITDVSARRHRFADRLNRTGIGWAGAATERYHVWNEDWSVTLDSAGAHVLRARGDDFSFELRLLPGRPPIAHGKSGYSRKGGAPGNASHYYSLTRMPTTGTLTAGESRFEVAGESWMDHEFGTSFLEPGQVGWDWFSVQFEDGTELMLFQLRRSDGSRDPASAGTLVTSAGLPTHLTASDFDLRPRETWRSPVSGADYPVAWSLTVPARRMSLWIQAVLPDQELHTDRSTGVTYWEGAVDVRANVEGRRVAGKGYLEMTGYAGQPMSDVLR